MRPDYRPRSARETTCRQRLGARHVTALTSALVLASLGTGTSSATQTTQPAQVRAGTCQLQTLALPGLTSTSRTSVAAMSDDGVVVGTSVDAGSPSTAVVWTGPDRIINTGIGGVVTEDQSTVSAGAVDVNEAGVVAINRITSTADGRTIAEDAVLWRENGGATVLPAPAFRPRASVTAINDKGHVVGLIRGRGHGSVAVIWKDGQRSRLPLPSRGKAIPTDLNNKGLVVGTTRGRFATSRPWTWNGGSRLRPLAPPGGGAHAVATEVDDSGRVVGGQAVGPGDGVRTIIWRRHDAPPRRLMRVDTRELHHSGYVAAVNPGFRGFGATAYVGHRRGGGIKAPLPTPPHDVGSTGWNNVFAVAVARGPSAFAPHGGVTIAGHAQDEELTTVRAILWTCTQTLL